MNDLKHLLRKLSSEASMHKDPMIPGMLSLSVSLRMSAEPGGEPSLRSCLMEIDETLKNTLNKCGFYQVDDTFIMQDGHTRPTITATYYAQKKTPEKNGPQ
jgi:hypothetical protein